VLPLYCTIAALAAVLCAARTAAVCASGVDVEELVITPVVVPVVVDVPLLEVEPLLAQPPAILEPVELPV
jgi:hypothetical protein